MPYRILARPVFLFLALLPFFLLLPTASLQSQDLVNGWQRSADAYNATLLDSLDGAIRAERFRQINSVIVIKDGKLLVERYYNGASRDQTHNPRSVGKTFAAAVLGIALAEGHLKSTAQTLSEFYDLRDYRNYDARKERITLHQLLTMSSGFDGFDFVPESPGNEENMYPQPNWVQWSLGVPMATGYNPGDKWYYFTAGVVVLGDILQRNVPGGLEVYAHDRLFAPLGISNYYWQHTPQRIANTAGGVQLTPLGFAKFGQLFKNRGRWQDRQILPATWVDRSFTRYFTTTEAGNDYGYLWWHKSYKVGKRSLPAYYCSGNGGNKIFVFENQPLVIVVTASAYGQRYGHRQVDEMMEQFILPAVLAEE